jgi:lipoprotein-releasing system permease protein
MQFKYGGQKFVRQVHIFGVRPQERARTGDFAEFLFDEKSKPVPPTLEVPEGLRLQSSSAGQVYLQSNPDDPLSDFLHKQALEQVPNHGAIIGWALATVHRDGKDEFIIPRGATIRLVYPKASERPEPGADDFTVVGFFKSGMSEHDSQHIYVPLDRFQQVRLLVDERGRGAVNQIQVKVRAGADLDRLRDRIQAGVEGLRPMYYQVSTWEQKQGPLLAAVAVEQSILNILLFFIIAVAGFGILAIFSMIVVEKTRDIGVMKALGASTAGVRGIFLGYGLLLGAVGSGVGMAGGLLFVRYINTIEHWLSAVTGRKVFDDSIYYFNEIPTLVEPWTVCWIVGGALFIAAAASVWPAQRAAKLHPVRALRFE